MRYLHWEEWNICAHNKALFAFNIFSNWRCRRDGTKKRDQFPTHATLPYSQLFSFQSYFFALSLNEREQRMANEGKIWVRDLPVIYFGAHKNFMHATCVREIPYQQRWWIPLCWVEVVILAFDMKTLAMDVSMFEVHIHTRINSPMCGFERVPLNTPAAWERGYEHAS